MLRNPKPYPRQPPHTQHNRPKSENQATPLGHTLMYTPRTFPPPPPPSRTPTETHLKGAPKGTPQATLPARRKAAPQVHSEVHCNTHQGIFHITAQPNAYLDVCSAYHAIWLEIQHGGERHAIKGRGCMSLPCPCQMSQADR